MLKQSGLVMAAVLVLAGAPAASAREKPVATPAAAVLAVKPAISEAAAKALIDGMAQEALSVLGSPTKTPEAIREKFRSLLVRNFDFPAIARFVLGRYNRVATPEQQAEYVKLFEEYVVSVYANRLSDYSGETITVKSTRADGADVLVNSVINLTKGQPPVAVDWKVSANDKGQPRITDVIIEQVSMSLTQRSEFGSLISSGGGKVESLLALLRNRVGGSTVAVANKAPADKQK